METVPTEQVAEIRNIQLPQGGELEVTMTKEFIAELRKHYQLADDQQLDDDHVRMYVWGSLNNAVEKAERELKQDVELTGTVERVPRTRRHRKKNA